MKQVLIRQKKFREYGELWPAYIFPAYLKLTPAEYDRLDELYRNHTVQIWPGDDKSPLELREIQY